MSKILDVTGPYEMFSWADLDVQLFAQEAGLVTCRGGLSVPVTTAFEYAPAFDWKDTLFVRTKIPFGGLQPDSKGYYRFIVRTRYERYIGEFVLHCHILDHEDSGMMQNVQIDLPVGPGGMSHEHH